MSKLNLVFVGLIFLAVSISCKSLMPAKATDTSEPPAIDSATPGKELDVRSGSIKAKRMGAYRVSGESKGVSFTGEICGLDKPFEIDAVFPGGAAKTSFTPSSAEAGATTMSGGGGGCIQTGEGKYTVTIDEEGSKTITWTTSDILKCPLFANSKIGNFTLPLKPAPEISCP